MFPEKIAKSHLLKLNRMLDDIARASRDLDALRLAYQCIADECENDLHCGTDCAPAPGVLGQAQAQRCAEIVTAHGALKSDIELALGCGTDGKQVCALQSRLDSLEDERDALDSDLRATQRSLWKRRLFAMEDPP
ncbi:hypothetical protein [Diaphorobacter caeni]|uniref:hypothetical protein n=1 Tax=Diaphorobacter caeni TaxID=2784387 RepID=UPI0018903BB7|nr:hypothetical protein [Diaphorobacter caeni]MBF5002741.1 hypothetical protein [Diaphorobacter caeni]